MKIPPDVSNVVFDKQHDCKVFAFADDLRRFLHSPNDGAIDWFLYYTYTCPECGAVADVEAPSTGCSQARWRGRREKIRSKRWRKKNARAVFG